MCGIVAISVADGASAYLYDALLMLQHRGQDSAGIVTEHEGKVYERKRNGLVDQVFRSPEHITQLLGNRGIGHVRYPTAGTMQQSDVQPFYVNSPFGIVLAHNGNLTNADTLRAQMQNQGRHINSCTDSEILLNIFANALSSHHQGNDTLKPQTIFAAVEEVQKQCKGAYSVVVLIVGYGVLAFRDRYGIRPLVYGTKQQRGDTSYIFASESIAVSAIGFELQGDVGAGEVIYIDNANNLYRYRCPQAELTPCVFEYVYLSRPDSVINGISVYKARRNMGISLGKKIAEQWSDHDIDIVVGVPDTSRIAAYELAGVLGVPYREALIKNRYIGRTFIMPHQDERRKSIKRKLNVIKQEFAGRNILLVDDSIVRGNTSREIVRMVRDAGAKRVYFASAAPPVYFQNVYGIDMPSKKELLAGAMSLQEAEKYIGCDRLVYQDMDDLEKSVLKENPAIAQLEKSVFCGEYITGDVNSEYLQSLEQTRDDDCKQKMYKEISTLAD